MDIFDKIKSTKGALGQYSDFADGYFMFPKLEGEIAPKMKFRGKEVLTWSLNNYLGLANNPEVRKADAEYAAKYGLAYPMGARMMSGQTTMHEKFEQMAAEFVRKESAYLLNYGYQGMVSIIDSLVDRHDVIVYDSESHACIMDGLRLHFGKRFVFPHNDIGSCSVRQNLWRNRAAAYLLSPKESSEWQEILVSLTKLPLLRKNIISAFLSMMPMALVQWEPLVQVPENILEFRIK